MKTWIVLCLISFLACASAFATPETFCNAAKTIPEPPSHATVSDCGREMISYTNWMEEEQRTANGHGDKALGCQRLYENYDKISNNLIEAQNFCSLTQARWDSLNSKVNALKDPNSEASKKFVLVRDL